MVRLFLGKFNQGKLSFKIKNKDAIQYSQYKPETKSVEEAAVSPDSNGGVGIILKILVLKTYLK